MHFFGLAGLVFGATIFHGDSLDNSDVFAFRCSVTSRSFIQLVEEAAFFWVFLEKLIDWHADLLFDFGQTGMNRPRRERQAFGRDMESRGR